MERFVTCLQPLPPVANKSLDSDFTPLLAWGATGEVFLPTMTASKTPVAPGTSFVERMEGDTEP